LHFSFDFAKRSSKKKRVYTQIRIGGREKDTQLYINKAQAPLATHKEIKIRNKRKKAKKGLQRIVGMTKKKKKQINK